MVPKDMQHITQLQACLTKMKSTENNVLAITISMQVAQGGFIRRGSMPNQKNRSDKLICLVITKQPLSRDY